MTDTPATDIFAKDPELRKCFQWIHAKKFAEAKTLLLSKLQKAETEADTESQGVVLSILGLLCKVQNDFKSAYKYYQKAEKCLPDDMTLKMISARLLVLEFRQFETALRKLKTILQNTTQDPVMQHHALALEALTYFQMGKRPQAKATFAQVLKQDFGKLRSAANVDYTVVETFLQKKFEVESCLDYLKSCLRLAESLKEKTMMQVLQNLLQIFS